MKVRSLPYCETFVTGHHKDAWVVIAEISAFVMRCEAGDVRQGMATVISMDIKMADEDATYYGHVIVEFA